MPRYGVWCASLHYAQHIYNRKLSFKDAQDGISNTFSIIPGALGKDDELFMGDFGDLGVELSDLGLKPDDLECNTCAAVPTLFEGLDRE